MSKGPSLLFSVFVKITVCDAQNGMRTFFLVSFVLKPKWDIKDFGFLLCYHKTILVETLHIFSTTTSAMRLPIPIRHSHSFVNLFM
jgi:hypothetical protein